MQSDGREEQMSPEERRLLSEQNRGNAKRRYEKESSSSYAQRTYEETLRREQEEMKRREREEAELAEMQAKMERLRQSELNRGKALQAQHRNEVFETDEPWQDEYDMEDYGAYRSHHEDDTEYGYDDDYESAYDDDRYDGYETTMHYTAPISGSAALAEQPFRDEERRTQEYYEEAPETDEPIADPERILTPAEDGMKRAAARSPQRRGTVSRGGRFNEKLRKVGNPNRITTGSAIVLGLLVILLLGLVIYGKVQTNEIYMKIASLQTERDDLISRNVSMRSEMEAKLTVKNVEEYAQNVLGLKQLDQSQIEYITIQTEDEVTITEPQDGWTTVIKEFFGTITDFLHGR